MDRRLDNGRCGIHISILAKEEKLATNVTNDTNSRNSYSCDSCLFVANFLIRRKDAAAAFAKTNAAKAFALAEAFHDHLVAVFEKSPLLAIWKPRS